MMNKSFRPRRAETRPETFRLIDAGGISEAGDEGRGSMKAVAVQLSVPDGMVPYLSGDRQVGPFERNAMLLYPFIQNMTISHGRAAEILGVHKADLIDYYCSIGIPYLDQTESELLGDLDAIDAAMRAPR